MRKVMNKLDGAFIKAQSKVRNFLTKKHDGLSGIIIAIGLILIAVIIILYFKSQTQDSLKNAVDTTKSNLDSITNELGGTANP